MTDTFHVTVTEGPVYRVSVSDDDGLESQVLVQVDSGGETRVVHVAQQGPRGFGIQAGGTTGQVSAKASNADYDVEWITPVVEADVDTAVAAEAVIRAAADTALDGRLDTIEADFTTSAEVASAVAGEAAIRLAADNALDGRLDTLEAVDNATQAELNAHKTSSDHDGRYYTETEVDALIAGRASDAELATEVTNRTNADIALQADIDDKASLSQDNVFAGSNRFSGFDTTFDGTFLAMESGFHIGTGTDGGDLTPGPSGYIVVSGRLQQSAAPLVGADLVNKTYADLKIPLTQRGSANGVATLDGGGKVPISQLPSSVMEYQGNWNASTNTPTLADNNGLADPGSVYRVSVAGTRSLGSGSIVFDVGDYVVANASGVWEKSDTTDAVASFNGRTGAVAPAVNDYAVSDINGLTSALAGKAALVHGHVISDTTGLQTALNLKADLASPTFTGTVTVPNVAIGAGTNAATIGAVNTALGAYLTTAAAATTYQPVSVYQAVAASASPTITAKAVNVLSFTGAAGQTITLPSTIADTTQVFIENTTSNTFVVTTTGGGSDIAVGVVVGARTVPAYGQIHLVRSNGLWITAAPSLSVLGTGTPSGSNFLRGDGTWAAAGGGTASGTTFTPAGDLAATDVQAALVELDTEKQPYLGIAQYSLAARAAAGTGPPDTFVNYGSGDGAYVIVQHDGNGQSEWGTPTASKHVATKGYTDTALALKANLASPTFTGTVTVPNVAIGAGTSAATIGAVNTALGAYLTISSANATFQPLDSDLTAIAGLTPSNDDFIQRKGGVWVSRTPAQVAVDVPKKVLIPHTFAVGGAIAVASGDIDYIPPMFIDLPSGQTAKLAKLRYRINSGTSATVKLQINGADATGFTSISATTTAAETDPTDITLADNDMIALVVTAVSGSPQNLSMTIFVEYTF